jgi:hypothetical protein
MSIARNLENSINQVFSTLRKLWPLCQNNETFWLDGENADEQELRKNLTAFNENGLTRFINLPH